MTADNKKEEGSGYAMEQLRKSTKEVEQFEKKAKEEEQKRNNNK